MLKSFKTEIQPSENQKILINKTIGVCRFIKNFYISENTKAHKNKESFITSNDFQVWLNNEFIPNNPDFIWIRNGEVLKTNAGKNIYGIDDFIHLCLGE